MQKGMEFNDIGSIFFFRGLQTPKSLGLKRPTCGPITGISDWV